MRNIKLTLEYDGSHFFGFQRQKARPTIQAALEEALTKLFNRPMKISAAAGRTDAGVHAKGQVVNFKVGAYGNTRLRPEKIQMGLNALLPKEIVVKKVREVPAHFHARYDAKWKTYEYWVLHSSIRSPLLDGRVFQFPYPLSLSDMKKAARRLVGRHDFKAFQSTGSSVRTSVRTVRRLSIQKKGNLIRFVVEADGFLYHMVRRMVGALLEVGRRKLSVSAFQHAVKEGEKTFKRATVPPGGLVLLAVEYPFKKLRK